jgi:hypothetical protein
MPTSATAYVRLSRLIDWSSSNPPSTTNEPGGYVSIEGVILNAEDGFLGGVNGVFLHFHVGDSERDLRRGLEEQFQVSYPDTDLVFLDL